MTSQHNNKQRSWRPDPTEYKDSQDVLADHGRTMTGYLGAALRWLNDDPERALTVLDPFWPDTRLGRPRGGSPDLDHPHHDQPPSPAQQPQPPHEPQPPHVPAAPDRMAQQAKTAVFVAAVTRHELLQRAVLIIVVGCLMLIAVLVLTGPDV